MEAVSVINRQILVLGSVMLIGFVAGKTGVIDKTVRASLSKLILNVTFAALLITTIPSVRMEKGIWADMLLIMTLALISVAGLMLAGLLSGKILGLSLERRRIFTILHMFGNVAFLAYPLLQALYGARGILYGALYSVINDACVWSLGVYLIKAGGERFSPADLMHMININLIAFAAGFGMLLSGVKLGGIPYEALHPVGTSTFYLTMLFVGANLSESRLRDFWEEPAVYLLSAVKLLAFPLLAAAAVLSLGLASPAARVAVLQIAMPSGVIVPLLAEMHGKDTVFAVRGVVATTLLSLATLPFMVYILGIIF
ncbi:MAG: AEC family transporter [Bacillota bacterium]